MAKRKKKAPAQVEKTPLVQEEEAAKEVLEAEKEAADEPAEPVEETVEETAEAAEEAAEETVEKVETENDPYAVYRYRWEAGRPVRRPMRWTRLNVLLVTGILAVGLLGLGFFVWLSAPKEDGSSAGDGTGEVQYPVSDMELVNVPPKLPEDALTVGEMIEAARKGVVCIEVKRNAAPDSVASGIIIREDGYIVTNYHVIEGADSITVYTDDGTSYIASPVGHDSLSDVAVLRIRSEELLPYVTLGDSNYVRPGDWVVAVGTPGNLELSASATIGIVSGVERKVQMQGSSGTKTYTVIQTDASINPGNSGGPLVNVYGQVIGITSLKLSMDEFESIGFALPINGVTDVARQIINTGRAEARPEDDYVLGSAAFGATYDRVSETEVSEGGLPRGVYVRTVTAGSAADVAGLKMGDVITSFDGTPVQTPAQITTALAKKNAGDVIEVKLWRAGEEVTVSVTLQEYRGD